MEDETARDGADDVEKDRENGSSEAAHEEAAPDDPAKAWRRQRYESYRAAHPEEFDADGNLLPEFNPEVERKVLDRHRAAKDEDGLPSWCIPVPKMPLDIVTAAPFTHRRVRQIPREGDTEDLLNGLIAECHYVMREVALPTVLVLRDATTRMQFLNTAMSLAETGAKVGRTVAKLRAAGAVTELRQRHIVEQVVTAPAPSTEKEVRT